VGRERQGDEKDTETGDRAAGAEPQGRRGRRRYPKEFRRDAAALVIDQRRTVADVAHQLGVVEQTLGNWVRQERIDRGMSEGLSSEDRARITEFERQVKRLTSERDLLKRSVAFWVKESDR
jgi:transposase-like protein